MSLSRFSGLLVALALAISCLVPRVQAAPVRAYPERPKLDFQYPKNVGKSFANHAQDSLVTNVPKLVSTTVYTAMSIQQDTLRLISSSTADSSYIVLYGITSSDSIGANLVEERVRVSGTDSVFATKKYAAFEMASADTESAGTITIVGKRNFFTTTILPGNLTNGAAVHFTGSRSGGITAWTAALDTLSNAGAPNAVVRCELRVYPDFKDLKATPETGFYVADRANLVIGTVTATASANSAGRTGGRSFVKDYGAPIFIPSHAAVGVFAASSSGTITTGVRVGASLIGYDSSSP